MEMIPETPSFAAGAPAAVTYRMARMLRAVRPASEADALRMLRAAFPQTTLQDRVSALARYRRLTAVAHVS